MPWGGDDSCRHRITPGSLLWHVVSVCSLRPETPLRALVFRDGKLMANKRRGRFLVRLGIAFGVSVLALAGAIVPANPAMAERNHNYQSSSFFQERFGTGAFGVQTFYVYVNAGEKLTVDGGSLNGTKTLGKSKSELPSRRSQILTALCLLSRQGLGYMTQASPMM